MLTLFPIQFLSLFAYFILRVCFGLLLFHLGTKALFLPGRRRAWLWFSIPATAAGLLLLVGLVTQLAALAALLISVCLLLCPRSGLRAHLPDSAFWVLAAGVSISLFITGAGVFAIDLPI